MTPSPDTRIAEIRARRATATPMPVLVSYDHGGGRMYVDNPVRELIADVYGTGADREFYAHALSDVAYLLEQLDSVPDQIRQAVEAERSDFSPLTLAGYKMANLLYNLAQYKTITEQLPSVVATMTDARERWDAAIRARGVKP